MTAAGARLPRHQRRSGEQRSPPTPVLLRQAAGVEKGAATPRRETVASVTKDQVRQIAETKMPDLNAIDIEGAMAQVAGTARSMGIEVVG